MVKTVVVGSAPFPFEPGSKSYAANLRAWQVTRLLLQQGHEVSLVGIDTSSRSEQAKNKANPVKLDKNNPLIDEDWFDRFHFYQILTDSVDLLDPGLLADICAQTQASSVVGIGNIAAYYAALLSQPIPVWLDLFGNLGAEGQAKAYTYDSDKYLDHFIRMEMAILERGDHFSTVSTPQKYALVGELGMSMRLNKASYSHDFVTAIPATLDETPALPGGQIAIRGQLCPADSFILLWSGGFNTWMDVDTLFRGVDAAMSRCPNLHFVITGGQIDGHDEVTFPRFKAMAEASENRTRYHFEGWVKSETLPDYYRAADAGIVVDKWSYEGVLGSRTRILEWGKYGLPVISTLTSEIIADLQATEAIFTFPHENYEALAELLVNLAGQGGGKPDPVLTRTGQNFKHYIEKNYAAGKVFEPLLEWVRNPRKAPDYAEGRRLENSGVTQGTQAGLLKYQVKRLQEELRTQLRQNQELKDWALSLEQQLLTRTGKPLL